MSSAVVRFAPLGKPSVWPPEDPEADESHRVLRGKLVYHSKDREAVYRNAAELRLKHSAFLYTGEIAADQVYVL